VVANPTSLHPDTAIRALDAGAHVYVEKPIGTSAADVQVLLARASRSRAIVAVGCQFRFNPGLERLKQVIDGGELGRILHVDVDMGEYLPDYHPGEDYRTGYAARRALGGGVLLTQIHDLNYLRWLFGPLESVYATGGKVSRLEIDVEDSVSMLIRSASGAGLAVHMDYLQRPRTRRMTVTGEDAKVVWDYYANTLTLTSPDGRERELGPGGPLDRNRMFVSTMADFLGAIDRGALPRTTLLDAADDLRVVDAIRESLAANAAVAVVRHACSA
jgi:predicted dehydrogenase